MGEDVHKHEYQYQLINFSDLECIKGLIKNRWMIDEYKDFKQNHNIFQAGDVKPVNQELICIYVDLDNLLDDIKLTIKQSYIVDSLMNGIAEEEIAEEFCQDVWRIKKVLDTVCRKVKDLNDYRWKYEYMYLNYLKGKWDYKQCGICNKYKPKIDSFFSPDETKKDGFKYMCKDCRR